MSRVYLDSAATNLVHDRVLDVATKFANMYRDTSMTTSEVFRKQKASLRKAREAVAGFRSF